MTPEQQALAMHYLPLARRLAKPFKETWAPYRDDFESAACLGLIEAAQTYDSSKHVKFPTFARRRILGELRDVKRDMQLSGWRDCEDPPTVEHLGDKTGDTGQVLGITADPPVETVLDAHDIVDHWLKRLPKVNATACRLIYLEAMTHRQAGAAMDRSKTRVQRLHKESLEILNESFRLKNKTAHPDDWVKAPLTLRQKAGSGGPETPTITPVDQPPPGIVEP
jgi:RNA polymerase sigma factor (sigma-70 family)